MSKPPEPVAAPESAGKPPAERRPPSPAAQRALAEAASRRAERDRHPVTPPGEIGGRDGPEPTRYGDWERNGLTCDF